MTVLDGHLGLLPPLVTFDLIERDELNDALVRWNHSMGPINRPTYRRPVDFGIRLRGELKAVVAADQLIPAATCGLTRADAFELSRLCAAERGLCSTALKLWRAFAFPDLARAWGASWVISYQNAYQHRGDIYRGDGWVILGYSRGGADRRARADTVTARKRVIWGWTPDADKRAARRAVQPAAPRWAA